MSAASTLKSNQILVGDALTQLRTLPSASIDCVVTSPPYFLLRNYAHDDQLGLESNVVEWVAHLVEVMDEVARVLKPTGSVWLNVGDSYSRHRRYGAAPKSLLLGPERLLLALSARGWVVRNKVVWTKPNPMPASVVDRLTCSWEPIYLLVRSRDYYFDLDAAREPHTSRRPPRAATKEGKFEGSHPAWAGPLAGKNDGLIRARTEGRAGHPLGKNPTDTWHRSTATFRGAHFAVYPELLIERPLLLSCPQRVCVNCGSPWSRERRRDLLGDLHPTCSCELGWQPGVVLDPFLGSGTTAAVAERLGRRWIGIELNPDYAALAFERLTMRRRPSEARRRSRASNGPMPAPKLYTSLDRTDRGQHHKAHHVASPRSATVSETEEHISPTRKRRRHA